MKLKVFKVLKDLLSITFVFIGLLALLTTIRINSLWGNIYFEQLLLNVNHGALAAGSEIMQTFFWMVFFPALVATFVLGYLIKSYFWLIIIGLIGLGYSGYKFELLRYIVNLKAYSQIYAQEYVNPSSLQFDFPENKRNLIVLYLESVEDDYANPALTGDNLLPNLSALKEGAISFNGFHQLTAQDYTIAAMVNSHCAIPYKKVPAKNYSDLRNFLPQLVCFPEILKNNGYRTFFIKGADLNFARTREFVTNHGYETALGKYEISRTYQIDVKSHQGTSWGYNDRTLYELAQKMLTEIAQDKSPFVFTMLTLDTHGPDVYLDKKCPKKYGDTRDVYLCADSLAAEFIKWIQQQDFYPQTTVVVVGDHTKIGNNPLYPNHPNRQIVNLIFNSAKSPPLKQRKNWTTIDLAPTILEALGIQFDSGKFGLGRSLFSEEPTLYEKMGDQFDLELLKSAKEYYAFEEKKRIFKPTYYPYDSWNVEINKPKDILQYASVADSEFNLVWLDTLSFTLPKQTVTPELMRNKDQTEKAERQDSIPNHRSVLKQVSSPSQGQIEFNISFKVLFMEQRMRRIKVYANRTLVDEWNVHYISKQPIYKSLYIPKKLITGDNKLLLEFQGNGLGHTPVSVGIGVESFSLQELDSSRTH